MGQNHPPNKVSGWAWPWHFHFGLCFYFCRVMIVDSWGVCVIVVKVKDILEWLAELTQSCVCSCCYWGRNCHQWKSSCSSTIPVHLQLLSDHPWMRSHFQPSVSSTVTLSGNCNDLSCNFFCRWLTSCICYLSANGP